MINFKRLLLGAAFCGLFVFNSNMGEAQTVVRVAPPAPLHVGVVGRPPRAGYVWTDGYYRWAGGRYVWNDGRWLRPPRPGMVWVPARWMRVGNGWAFQAGHWR